MKRQWAGPGRIVAKTFARRDYDRCDGRAKDAAVRLLRQRGHTNFDTEERMATDVISTTPDGGRHYCEVEIKECWKGRWPASWKSVHLPERRLRALNRCKDGALIFLLFRNDLQQAWEVPSASLSLDLLTEVPNKYVRKGERMFDVPLHKATLLETLPSDQEMAPAASDSCEETAPYFIL